MEEAYNARFFITSYYEVNISNKLRDNPHVSSFKMNVDRNIIKNFLIQRLVESRFEKLTSHKDEIILKKTLATKSDILSCCGPLIEVYTDRIYFTYLLVKEFLLATGSVLKVEAHNAIAITCGTSSDSKQCAA